MTEQQILGMRMGTNQVLIRLDRRQDQYKMKKGGHLYIDNTFDPERHAPITGHIVSLCERLFFSQKKPSSQSLQWDTDIELEVGDYIVSYYLAAHNAGTLNDGRMMVVGDHTYLILRYDQIFAARREGKLITCNGWNLLTPVIDKNPNKGLWKGGEKTSKKVARMAYRAIPNRAYWEPWIRDDQEMPQYVNPGELVLVRRNTLLPLEYAYHTSLDGDKVYYRVQWNNIYATCDEQVLG